MLAEMSPREVQEWERYLSTRPFPVERIETGLGLLTSVLANIHRDSKKQPQPFEVRDFIADWRPKEEREADDQRRSKQQMHMDAKKKKIEESFKRRAAELREKSSA